MQHKRRKPFLPKDSPTQSADETAAKDTESGDPLSATAIDTLCAGLARQILRHFPDGWGTILDRNFCYLLIEGLGLKKLGWSPEQFVGKTIDEVLPPEKAEQLKPFFQRAFAGEEVSFEFALEEKRFFAEASLLQETLYPAGAILVMAHNITSHESKETPPVAAETEAQTREYFLSLVAHELRTPLTVISGLVQMLERGKIDENKRAETLKKLREQTKRLQRLIDDLLGGPHSAE